MTIISTLKPALISHWCNKAFKEFYPLARYYPSDSAPDSWEALKAYKGALTIPVFNGACEHTIHASEADNVSFRAWHDTIHLAFDLSFTKEHEIAVGLIHCDQLRLIGAPTHVINAVYFDVIGQTMYYARQKEFVRDQRHFVQLCLDNGLDYVLGLGKIF